MALKNWWQVAIPHKDIKQGKLNDAIFAADLDNVVKGIAPIEYQDPVTFFQKTYLTNGLRNLLSNVVNRLNGEKSDPVIQLQTPFGGGKTHALVILYHIIKNYKQVKHLSHLDGIEVPENAKVAVFVGTNADVLGGKTPWGEIAYQLGKYEIVAEHDKERVSPGKEKLREIIESSGPTLILFDEILEYIVKANQAEKVKKIIHGQTLAFLQEISEVVAASKNACLVITLPASIMEAYDEEAEKALTQLQKVSGRVESIYTPVEGMEIYEVIRKRLFENIGSAAIRKEVAQNYFELYQKLGADVPPEFKSIEYREKIEHTYPFHPELIDVLYERWGSLPTFQRTRGVLRLLAEIVADTYSNKLPSPLIQSSIVNLQNQSIRREFIKHIGNEYESVIASDITGKAYEIDKQMGSEYEIYKIASGIAASVFLYSFSGGLKNGISLPRLRIALLREGIPHTIVSDAVNKLAEQLWYFHSEGQQYVFRNRPNLNRVIVDIEETITDEIVLQEFKSIIQKKAGNKMEVFIWPESSSDIQDNKNLKLSILSPDLLENSNKFKDFNIVLLEKAGNSFRIYKNTLFIVATDENQYFTTSKSIRKFLALKKIYADKNIYNNLTSDSQNELKQKINELEKDLPFKVVSAYRFLSWLEKEGLVVKDMGILTTGSRETISERVNKYLKDQEKILDRITPKYIIEKIFANSKEEKSIEDIFELFLKIPGMPVLENERVLINAIKDGVSKGFFGVKDDKNVYFQVNVNPEVEWHVIPEEIARQIIETQEKKDESKVSPVDLPPPPDIKDIDDIIKEKSKVNENSIKVFRLKFSFPWHEIHKIIPGVINPLKEKANNLNISIEIKADTDSELGFDRNTLDNKVKETLNQINAKIEIWEEY